MSLSRYTTLSSPPTSTQPIHPLRPRSASSYPPPPSSASPGSPKEVTLSPRLTQLQPSISSSGDNGALSSTTSMTGSRNRPRRTTSSSGTTAVPGMTLMHKTKQGAKDDAMIRWF
ncbi:BQ2448_5908 [Microbotryum intermedium]|uniref:BQ2448_5908 protein n=1 Tax=Microbotryum intermedium TaxID=269621 RepID=A0A238EZH9_9BASI|nr:BQ2448_5908 [Microbotryum intermedium]